MYIIPDPIHARVQTFIHGFSARIEDRGPC
jgi:hypothetical protein